VLQTNNSLHNYFNDESRIHPQHQPSAFLEPQHQFLQGTKSQQNLAYYRRPQE
jgi:hypothetical protein